MSIDAAERERRSDSHGWAGDNVPLWVGGEEVHTSTAFQVQSPNNGQTLWNASSASSKEAVRAVEAAQSAFKTWRRAKPTEIQRIFLKAADLFQERRQDLASYMQNETGALEGFTGFNIETTISNLRDIAGRPAHILGEIPQVETPGQAAFIFKEPFGVNLGIAPWNAPYILGTRAFLYAIAAGNTVVLKGSELCPKTFWAIGSIFHDAGLPAGVLNILFCQPADAAEVTNALIEHPAVRKVNFTGSTAVGSIIASKAGKELKPVLMELGGKASAIVCDDANLSHAAHQCALGALLHAGQICMSTERIIVHRSILERFSEALKAASDTVYAPDKPAPTLVAAQAVKKNRALMSDAVSKGATVLHGDLEPSSHDTSAHRMRPIIITDITKEMDIFYTESFGPTVSLIAVDSDEEAIDLANDTEYGLSGSVFTESLARGLRIAREVDSGAIHINSMSVHDESRLPHGGVKKSGWGRFNAQWGIEEFLKLKTVTYMTG